jgi:hypothetical protein
MKIIQINYYDYSLMDYNYIINCLNTCEQHLNEGGGKITSIVLSSFTIPEDIKLLIKENYKLVKKIIEFYYKDFTYKSSRSDTFEDAMSQIKFITEKTNNNKIQLIEYSDILFKWLLTTEFFNNIYENYAPNIIDPLEIKPINLSNDFILRDNQKEAFYRLERNGLETGIHCQATGCGKTYIILKYIDYAHKNIKNPKIILFTERVNILSDLFSFTKNKLEPDIEKLKYWKEKGLVDLTNFNIINRVTNKNKNWDSELRKSKKPTLLVINRAFLTLGKKYNIFNYDDLHLILHDECHNTTSLQCHEFLTKARSLDIKIVGFSATPLRTGKFDKTKLLEIYSKEDKNELNLLTNYNMIYAISKNLILPPEFYWYQIETYNKNDNELVTQEELGSVFEILNQVVPTLPNKKIIAWCGTINMARFWKKEIEKTYKQREHLRNFKFGLDTSADTNEDYNNFSKIPKDINNIIKLEDLNKDDPRKMYYGNSILFCANKHREGSDIKLLDCCIFLDKVKDRGSIPFIQSIGRTLRICPDTVNKTKGVIIDGFIKDNNGYEKNFVDKIIGYYIALENINNLQEDKFNQYIKIMDIVKFDKEQKIINMNNLKINCNRLDWDNIISKFENVLENKLNVTPEEAFNLHINKIKSLEQFKNPENDFWKEYKKLDHSSLGIPEDIYEPYKEIWDTKTWYDILGFKDKYISLENFKNNFCKKYPGVEKINKSIYKKVKLEFNLPNYPFEYYRTENINDYYDLI